MRISVVTVCRNSSATIARCAASVMGQQSIDIEYIVIDGGSTDNTFAQLAPFRDRIAHLVSEPDHGIYDAMNKGLARATGELVGFLNSDDMYATPQSLATRAATRSAHGADIVFGDIEYVDAQGRIARIWRADTFRPENLRAGIYPPHPGFYANPSLCREVGGFEKSYEICGDFDLMIRLFARVGPAWRHVPQTLVKMALGGVSTRGLGSYPISNRELVAACEKRGLVPDRVAIYGRIVRKGLEVLKGRLRRAGT